MLWLRRSRCSSSEEESQVSVLQGVFKVCLHANLSMSTYLDIDVLKVRFNVQVELDFRRISC